MRSPCQEAGNVPVYYMFYNPLVLPTMVTLPATPGGDHPESVLVGTRVVPYKTVALAFDDSDVETSYSPSYADLLEKLPAPFQDPDHRGGWRLESFIADEVLRCREGYRTTDLRDRTLETLFYRRSGPIAAAFAITINGPARHDVDA
jgi:hypothetical protein